MFENARVCGGAQVENCSVPLFPGEKDEFEILTTSKRRDQEEKGYLSDTSLMHG